MDKVFLFSDLHCSNKQLANLYDFFIQKDNDIKALVFAGDVVNMGEPVWFMEKFIEIIDKLNLPLLWVPGNNDFGRAYYKLTAKYKSLEGRIVEFDGRAFTGVGGSPTSWSGQYAGENMIDKKAIAGSIFLSHVPPPANIKLKQFDIGNQKFKITNPKPFDSAQRAPFGAQGGQIQNINDQNLKRFDKFEDSNLEFVSDLEFSASNLPKDRRLSDAPLVHICGHLHYRWGTAYLGQTKVIQLASLETGHYAIMDLETLAVEFRRF